MKAIPTNGSSSATKLRLRRILTWLFVGLSVPGCSDNQQPPQAVAPDKIVIKGSNTIGEELAPRIIEAYKKDHPAAAFDLESKATGYGLAALLAGQCDIAAASREPIKDELEIAQSRGIELTNYIIGSYSVAVIVNGANPVGDLTRDQVRDIFIGTIQNWKDPGGPDAPVHLYIRDPISGTYLGFRELAMENKPYASGIKTFTNYAAIVQAVARDPNGIGYASFDLANKSGVKALSIAGVAPTAASVNDGKYPYARMLRFYTAKAKEKTSAADFIKYVESPRGQEVLAQAGYVPHP